MREQSVVAPAVDGLAELVRGFLDEGPLPVVAGETAAIVLDRPGAVLLLADIITDEGGACVLDAEGPDRSLTEAR